MDFPKIGGGIEDFLLEMGGKSLMETGFKMGIFIIFLICKYFLCDFLGSFFMKYNVETTQTLKIQ